MLLALLALDAGRVVRISAVIDGLWDDDPPSSARALVHTYVSALRRALDAPGAPQIATLPGGYRLDCEPEVVDVHRLLTSTGSDDPSLWDAALADSAQPLLGGLEIGFAEPWQVRIDAARDLLQDRVWARRLDEGGAAEVLPELEQPSGASRSARTASCCSPAPWGRSAASTTHCAPSTATDAGSARSSAWTRRRRCRPCVRPSSPVHPRSRRSRNAHRVRAPPKRHRGLLLAVAGTAAIVAGALVLVALQDDDGPTSAPAVTGPALISVDPSDGSLSDAAELPVTPSQIEADGDVVWVRSVEDQAVAALDLGADGAAEVTGVAAPPSALALDNAAAVVGLGFSGETVTVSNGRVSPPTLAVEGSAGRLTLAGSDNGVWVATITGDVHAPDGTAGWQTPVSIGVAPLRLGIDGTRAWAITSERAELVAIDASDTPAVRSPLRGEAVDLTTGDDQAWAVTSGDDRLWHAAATGRVVATRALPGTPVAVLLAGDAIWVAMASPPGLASYDPQSLEPSVTVDLPREPVDLAVFDGRLVVAVR